MTTYGERFDAAMAVTTEAEATNVLGELVGLMLEEEPTLTHEEAERATRSGLAYWAGYFGNETRARIERLFACAHPFFGAIAENGPPTTDETFALGVAAGARLKASGE